MSDAATLRAAKKLGEDARRWREQPQVMVRELFGVTPDPWQDEALIAFPTSPRMAFKAPISLDAVVFTPDGERLWSDIRPGDHLFAEDGTSTRVVRRIDVGAVPLFRVVLADGTSLRVSADHEWDIFTPYDRKRGGRRTVTTRQLAAMPLRRGKQRLVSLPVGAAVQLSERELPADPYLLGLWIGDGVANEPRLICPDHGIRDAIRQRGQPITESRFVAKRIGLPGWLPALRATGISACRSYEKVIPAVYKRGSVRQRLDLLRGMMDSDGTVTKNGQVYLATSSFALATDFVWLARSLGYYATIGGPYKIKGGEYRDSYRATISGPTCPFHAGTSKKKRWRAPRPQRWTRFVDSVEPCGEGPAMCVEVEHQSHCFQAADFIVTHNCKGPGKTALLSWLGWNFLLTRPHPMIGATSISGDNLKAGLWTELARWYSKAPLLEAMFEMTKSEIFARQHPKTWKLEARTWARDADPAQIGNALAGVHADYVMWLLDESGDYPDAIMPTAEGIFSGAPKEAHIIQAGNPTRLAGPLYRACTLARKLWKVIEITADPDDPMRTPRVSVEVARQQIEQYGRDNPWVLVNIFGQFPPSSLNALIGPDEVSAAMKRYYRADELRGFAKVIGVDVAREGDDMSVIAERQGLQAFPFRGYRNIDSVQGAGVVARRWQDWGADAAFVDATGGFGAGWIDQLRILGRAPIGVQFSATAHQQSRYYNKRTEMYFDLVEWIKRGGAVPESAELLAALTQTLYTFKKDKLLLEPKDMVKAKLGYSPDHADALALTFAEPVLPASAQVQGRRRMQSEYDPYAQMNISSAIESSYDPFSADRR